MGVEAAALKLQSSALRVRKRVIALSRNECVYVHTHQAVGDRSNDNSIKNHESSWKGD